MSAPSLLMLGAVLAACLAGPPAAGAARKADPVRTTIDRAAARGAIDAEARAEYLDAYSAARRTLRGLSGQRRAELGSVLGLVRSLAREQRLTARLRPVFLILERNREWWAKAGPPGSDWFFNLGYKQVADS